ncbi:MAG TPA: penicillin acylase family protein [Acidimicrobiales bacterium]
MRSADLLRRILALIATSAVVAAFPAIPAGGQVQELAPPDPLDVLARVTDSAVVAGTVTPPGSDTRHATREIEAYDTLVQTYPLLADEPDRVLGDHFKDGRFRPVDDPERTYHPRADVTVVRDRKWGVPHIYGHTDAGMFFGAGYTMAEDRLAIFELLRALGRAEAFDLLETGPAWFADAEMVRLYGYTEAEFQAQIDRLPALYDDAPGQGVGTDIVEGLDEYVNGINAYLAEAQRGEVPYPAGISDLFSLTDQNYPGPYTTTDVVAAVSTVRALFGAGGGGELGALSSLLSLQDRYGLTEGLAVYEDFRNRHNEDGPVHTDTTFDYHEVPELTGANIGSPTAGQPGLGVLLEDLLSGDLGVDPTSIGGDLSALAADVSSLADEAEVKWDRLKLETPAVVVDLSSGGESSMSNFFAVDGTLTESGNPIMIGGPQAGYFSPQIFNEYELHGDTIHARGASFPGLTALVVIGRTQDYAFTATAGGSDMIDTYVDFLCEPDGSDADERSDHYLYDHDGDGEASCLPMYRRLHRPATDVVGVRAGTKQLPDIFVERTVHGNVVARGDLGGVPVAVSKKRSSYMKELDAAVAMARVNRNEATTAQDYVDIMTETMNLSTNWLYASADEIGYVHGGVYPLRPDDQHPDFPVDGRHVDNDWDYDVVDATGVVAGDVAVPLPDGSIEWRRDRQMTTHPHYVPAQNEATGVDRHHLVSWNNRPAPGWGTSDASWDYDSIYRSMLLEEGIVDEAAAGNDLSVPEVVQIMEEAGLTDLRGRFVAPLALAVLGDDLTGLTPDATHMVGLLEEWVRDKSVASETPDYRALRRDGDGDGSYDHGAAVAAMDAWWNPLIDHVLGDVAGRIRGGRDNAPNSAGSAYQGGYYGHVWTALAQVLGNGFLADTGPADLVASIHEDGLRSPHSTAYCGGRFDEATDETDGWIDGDQTSCRAAVVASLNAAAATLGGELESWDADPTAERILFLPAAVLSMQWVNRPTTQVLASFHDPDDAGPGGSPMEDPDPTGPTPPEPLGGSGLPLVGEYETTEDAPSPSPVPTDPSFPLSSSAGLPALLLVAVAAMGLRSRRQR